MTDSILRSYYNVSSSTFVPFVLEVPPSGGAWDLLLGETEGIALDATTEGGTFTIKDTGTPANDKTNVALQGTLQNTGTSGKWLLDDAGVVVFYAGATDTIFQEYIAADSQWGMISEGARTNLALWSKDFTNAAWTKSNMTTSMTATGPSGTSNDATILTATAGNATVLQSITDASAARVTSMWVKRRTGSGNIDMTQDNGSTWSTVTVTGSWTRVNTPTTEALVYPTNPIVGIRIVTSGDAVDVWGFMHESAGAANVCVLTSTIITTSATVTRSADLITYGASATPYDATVGSCFAWFRGSNRLTSAPGANMGVLTVGTNGRLFYLAGGNDANMYDGTTALSGTGIITGTNRTTKGASKWSGASMSITAEGDAPQSGAFDGTMATDGNIYYLSGGGGFTGWIYQAVIYTRALSDAEMQTVTT